MFGHTCCKRAFATHWSHTAHTAAAAAAAADSRRPGSTVPTDCNQPEGHQMTEM